MAIDFGRIALPKNQSSLLIGGTRSGKSTLEEMLVQHFLQTYAATGARAVIADTKPRFRAQWNPNGTSARLRYRNWSHGPFIPNSVVVQSPAELDAAWRTGHRIAIIQAPHGGETEMQAAVLDRFLKSSKAKRPQLAAIDEALDFFHANGTPKHNDAVIRLARAGNERGTGVLYCSQRTKGFAPALLELMSILYCFRIDYVADAKRFQEFGCPEFTLPEENHYFRAWFKRERRHVYGPYHLALAA